MLFQCGEGEEREDGGDKFVQGCFCEVVDGDVRE